MKFDWKKQAGALGNRLKQYRMVLLVLGAGLILLLWPGGEGSTEQKASTSSVPSTSGEVDELTRLEQRLEEALGAIRGVGRVEVVLTLQSDERVIYASEGEEETDADGSASHKTELARISTGSGQEETIEVTRLSPVYQGALVVCDGGDDSRVKLAVTQSVSVLTGLSSDRISVCGRGEMEGSSQ